jgi:tetratricopeptide (TPR) repeat protein
MGTVPTAPQVPAAVVLQPGTPVGRYVLRARIGEGGMGVVYAAHDPELDRVVALKVLRADAAGDPAAVRTRVQREAQALARLADPHVVAVYDVGASDHGIFIAMELVEGETLRAWLRAPRPWRAVLATFIAAGRGLEAAHRAGLIHRDFKPDNVLVGNDGRVRVTDFGLARLIGSDEPPGADAGVDSPLTLSVTRTGALLGTPGYMAPEQLCGDPVDARADLFSFCVALYEALYRVRPFAGGNVAELRASMLQNRLTPPARAGDAAAPLRRVLARGLRAAPDERFASMGELLDALDAAARPPRRGRWIAGAAALVLAAIVAGVALHEARRRPLVVKTAHGGRAALAVLALGNRGPADAAWLAPALTESLAAALTEGERVRVVAPAEVARAQRDFASADKLDGAAREQLRRRLGVDYLVTGSYRPERGRVRVALTLVDAAGGDRHALDDESAPEGELDALTDRLAASVRQRLGLPALGPGEAPRGRAFPSQPAAMRAYAEGLTRLRAFEPQAARVDFQRALTLEPNNPMIHAALAQAWNDLGHSRDAEAEGERAFKLSSELSREQRLALEAQYRVWGRQWARAIEIDQALITFFPDNLEYYLQLAQAQSRGSQGKDALATVERMRQLPQAAGDPRVTLAEERALSNTSDWTRLRTTSERLAEEARLVHAPSLEGTGLMRAGTASQNLGEYPTAIALLGKARRILHDTGDRAAESAAVSELAVVARRQGQPTTAIPLFDEAIALARAVGNDRLLMNYEAKQAVAVQQTLEMHRAQQLFQDALSRARQIDDPGETASILGNYANVQMSLGDLDGAIASVEESVAIYEKLSLPWQRAVSHLMLAEMLRYHDRLADAMPHFAEAMRTLGANKARPFMSASYVEAELALARDRPREAEAAFRRVVDATAWGDVGLQATSWAELSRTLLIEGKTAEARRAYERAAALLPKMDNRLEALCTKALLAEVSGRSGDAEERARALRTLQAALAEADAHTLVSVTLEMGLSLARVEAADGRREAARARLQALAAEAGRHGFALVARRAREELRR